MFSKHLSKSKCIILEHSVLYSLSAATDPEFPRQVWPGPLKEESADFERESYRTVASCHKIMGLKNVKLLKIGQCGYCHFTVEEGEGQ